LQPHERHLEPAADLELPVLPLPRTAPARGRIARWLLRGGAPEAAAHPHDAHSHPWHQVLWLTGVDYFSTLGYQPGIALLAAGALSPLATIFLVALTLCGVLPVYIQVARRSFAGQGSIAMLESLLPGWGGKIFVLVLLGFATTDFVITMTLSAADAAKHAVENPLLHPYLGDHVMALTLFFLAVLALIFLKGFREAIGVAMAIAIPYMALNAVVIGRGLMEIARHPEFLEGWRQTLALRGDWPALLAASALVFPKLALGLSGFETGVAVMPQISGAAGGAAAAAAAAGATAPPATPAAPAAPAASAASAAPPATAPAGPIPFGRIRATRKLLVTAACLMSTYLIASSFVISLLVDQAAVAEGGPAAGRALAHVAHQLLGHGFGTVYDISTIAILWFAGASAMAAMLNLVPRYLPRFGMAPRWVAFARPLVLVLFVIDVLVTLAFQADVEKQGGAYATGVLVLVLSASVAVTLALGREAAAERDPGARWRAHAQAWAFWVLTAVLGYTLVVNVIERPDGVIVSSIFIGMVVVLGAVSRYTRAGELRVERVACADAESRRLWPLLVGKKVHLIALKTDDPHARERKRAEILRHYRVSGPFAFVNVQLLDNRSEFLAPLQLHVSRLGPDFEVRVTGAVAVANSLAYLSELIDPIAIYLGLTRQNLMTQSLRYFLLGEGEVGLSVYSILVRYWEWTPEDDVRPFIFLVSE
jgi:hypothetical protein